MEISYFWIKKGELATRSWIVLPLLLLITISEVFAAPVSQKSSIIPGGSVGGVRLGEDMEIVLKRLGQPKSGDAAMGRSWQSWYAKGDHTRRLDIYSVRNFSASGPKADHAYVQQIQVTSPWFSVAPISGSRRIAPGSRLDDILRAFPKAQRVSHGGDFKANGILLYDDKAHGIAFEFLATRNVGKSARCASILIHPRGQSVADEYYPPTNYR